MAIVEKELFFLAFCLIFQLVCGKRNTLSEEKELQVEKMLKLFNKPAVITIQSEKGDAIDCVDLYKQPAFDHPQLRKHIVKMRPSDNYIAQKDEASKVNSPFQVWHKSGNCPNGTIPILRVQKQHLLNSPSLAHFGRKPWHGISKRSVDTLTLGVQNLHSHSVLVGGDFQYAGVKANLNLWNPIVEQDDEFSTGQIWLKNGVYDNFDSIEAGWIVNPSLFGDRSTRFFVYWTSDSGRATGCFNLLCPGFVQTTNLLALGSAFANVSNFYDTQFQISLAIEQDPYDLNWWLLYGDIRVGYWPFGLFNTLGQAASQAWFGGDVYSSRLKTQPHTGTNMGSGQFPSFHWSAASWISNPRLMDFYTKEYAYPNPAAVFCSQRHCYNGENYASSPLEEPLFYFGGPGRNQFCG